MDKENIIYGNSSEIKRKPIKIINVNLNSNNVCVAGKVIKIDYKEIKDNMNKVVLSFDLYDNTSTIGCKAIVNKNIGIDLIKKIENKRNKS